MCQHVGSKEPKAEVTHRRIPVTGQDGILAESVDPVGEKNAEVPIRYKVDTEERQEPVSNRDERPHAHDAPHHLVV